MDVERDGLLDMNAFVVWHVNDNHCINYNM